MNPNSKEQVCQILRAQFPNLDDASGQRTPLELLEVVLKSELAAQMLGVLVLMSDEKRRNKIGWHEAQMLDEIAPVFGYAFKEQKDACKYLQEEGLIQYDDSKSKRAPGNDIFLQWLVDWEGVQTAIEMHQRNIYDGGVFL